MNDETAQRTARYLSRKAKPGTLILAYYDDKADKLVLNIYDNPTAEQRSSANRLRQTRRAFVFHRGKPLADTDAVVHSYLGTAKGGAS